MSELPRIILSPISKSLISLALEEDIGTGDVTAQATIPETLLGQAEILSRGDLVVCGHAVAEAVFRSVSGSIHYEALIFDSKPAADGEPLARIVGPLRAILTAERTALNFFQRLSGVATLTNRLVSMIAGSGVSLLDTRKTTPGFRQLEKYAVVCGGGRNHRMGLYDQVLIKNNHIDVVGDIQEAIKRCRQVSPKDMKLEVEVRNMSELSAAMAADPDIILLDNMKPDEVSEAIKFIRARQSGAIYVEASGGIHEQNLTHYANTGVDALSIGALTHSAPAVDISLRYRHGAV